MVTLARRRLSVAMLTLAAGASIALGDLPAAIDRVPAGTPIIVGIRSVDTLKSRVMGLLEQLHVPLPEEGLSEVNALLKTEGVNSKGSVALALTPPAGDDGHPKIIALVPVSDGAALIKALKGDPAQKIATVTMPGEEAQEGFAKDIGGGYVAFADQKDSLETFEGKGGNIAAISSSIGETGKRIGDASDFLIVLNLPALKPMLEEGVNGWKQQMKQMEAMMGAGGGPQADQMKAGFALVTGAADAFVNDGQAAVVGLNIDGHGLNADFAAQFKEGSKSAATFAGKGNSLTYLSRLPNQNFLIAAAMDFSAPSTKKFMQDMQSAMPNQGGGMGQWGKMMSQSDGAGFIMGQSDLGAGLLVNSAYYFASKEPQKLADAQVASMKEMSGKNIDGVKYTVTHKPDAAEVAGMKVATWSMSMDVDADNPMGPQIEMINNFMFGPEGLNGYSAVLPNAVITTMSKNSKLLTAAIESAKGGKGLGDDELLKGTAASLPADRTMEFYIGSKTLLDTIGGVMAMTGQNMDIKAPDKLAPIGMALTTSGGGVALRLHMPTDVMKVIADLQKMEEGGEEPAGDMKDEKKPAKAPRF